MRISQPNLAIPVAPTKPSSEPISERRQSSEASQQRRAQDQINAQALIPSAAMSFAINLVGNSITVTLADRTSGEVFRQLVYEFGGLPTPPSEASGKVIDVTA